MSNLEHQLKELREIILISIKSCSECKSTSSYENKPIITHGYYPRCDNCISFIKNYRELEKYLMTQKEI